MRLAGRHVARRAAVATLVSGVVTAGTLSLVMAANASPVSAERGTRTVIPLQLRAMPAGRVLLFRDEGNNQGDSNTILSNGQPTIAFRPLLCANI